MNDHSKNTTESIIAGVARRLRGFKGRISEMSRATGVELNSIHRIARGENVNPTVQTIQPLIDWMDAEEAPVVHRPDFTRMAPWGYPVSFAGCARPSASVTRHGIPETGSEGSRPAPQSEGARS